MQLRLIATDAFSCLKCVADTNSQLCSKLPNCSSGNTFGFDSVVYLEDTDENMALAIAQYMEQK